MSESERELRLLAAHMINLLPIQKITNNTVLLIKSHGIHKLLFVAKGSAAVQVSVFSLQPKPGKMQAVHFGLCKESAID